jgi:hypothetical protein
MTLKSLNIKTAVFNQHSLELVINIIVTSLKSGGKTHQGKGNQSIL